MSDWPRTVQPNSVVISPLSLQSIGLELAALVSGTAASTWPSACLAIFIPFSVERPTTITQMFTDNSASFSGNIDVGIYDAGGSLLVSSGSVSQSASAIQTFNITDTTLNPGLYYLAAVQDVACGGMSRAAGATASGVIRALGVVQMASAYPLPATATFASAGVAYIPIVCATQRSVI